MTEAMPFLQKFDITFLRPPTIGTELFCIPKTTRWASGSKEAAADEEK